MVAKSLLLVVLACAAVAAVSAGSPKSEFFLDKFESKSNDGGMWPHSHLIKNTPVPQKISVVDIAADKSVPGAKAAKATLESFTADFPQNSGRIFVASTTCKKKLPSSCNCAMRNYAPPLLAGSWVTFQNTQAGQCACWFVNPAPYGPANGAVIDIQTVCD